MPRQIIFLFAIVSFLWSPCLQAFGVYSSERGRWITRDRVTYVNEANPVSYAIQNPIRFVDPDGEFPILPSDPHVVADQPTQRNCIWPPNPGVPPTPQQVDCEIPCKKKNADFGGFAACDGGAHVCCICILYQIPPSTVNLPYIQAYANCLDKCEPKHYPNYDCPSGAWNDSGVGRYCSECSVAVCMRSCFKNHPCENAGHPALVENCNILKQHIKDQVRKWCNLCAGCNP